ncbi:hypothetical protein Hanom_Chr07g00676551 [Helianthus anomalus]
MPATHHRHARAHHTLLPTQTSQPTSPAGPRSFSGKKQKECCEGNRIFLMSCSFGCIDGRRVEE